MVHGLDCQQYREFCFGLFFRHSETEIQLLASRDQIFKHLVDGILIDAGPTGDKAANRLTDTGQKSQGGHVVGKLRRIGKQSPKIPVIDRGPIDAIVPSFFLVMLTQGLAQAAQWIDLFGDDYARLLSGQGPHELIDIGQLLERRPARIPLLPLRFRRQPNGKCFGEIFIGMALRVPRPQMHDKAFAVRFKRIVIGVRDRRFAEELLTPWTAAGREGILDGMTRFVPKDAHAPVRIAALDFEHLIQLKFRQTRVREIKRDGNAGDTIGGEPFIREPEVRSKAQPAFIELSMELRDALLKRAAFKLEMQVAEAKIEQLLVG